jgi:hypothetical protein
LLFAGEEVHGLNPCLERPEADSGKTALNLLYFA